MLPRPPLLSCWRPLVYVPSTSRSYAISVQPPKVWPGKTEERHFSPRKTYLYNQFASILNPSHSILFLRHKDFNPKALINLRKEIATAVLKHAPTLGLTQMPKLTVVRTSIFGVALRDHQGLDSAAIQQIAELGEGSMAVLSLPDLNPPQLNAIIRAMQRAVPGKRGKEEAKKRPEDDENYVPGRRQKRVRPRLDPELYLLGALIEGKVFAAAGVKDVAKLPTLDTLRAQIVGLISSPGMQLAAVLNEAAGGRLSRTLEGLKKSLEENAGSQNPETPS